MQVGAIQPGQNVVVIDDLVATGEQYIDVLPTRLFLTSFSRRFCQSRRRAYRQTGRKDRRIRLRHRNSLLKPPFNAQRTRLLDHRGQRGVGPSLLSRTRIIADDHLAWMYRNSVGPGRESVTVRGPL